MRPTLSVPPAVRFLSLLLALAPGLSMCLSVSSLAEPIAAQRTAPDWYEDFDKALRVAKKTRKGLFVNFTGSDWCGWCIKLHEQVLSKDEFAKKMRRRFVLVSLDHPMGDDAKARVPDPERNAALREEYGIRGYPTVLLLRRDGVVLGRTGYREGDAAAYVKHLMEVHAAGKKTLENLERLGRRLSRAKPADKVGFVREVLELVKPMEAGAPGHDTACSLLEEAFVVDPDNAKGLLHEVIQTTLDNRTATPGILERVWKYDPKNEKKVLQRIVLSRFDRVRHKRDIIEFCDELERLVAAGVTFDQETTRLLHYNAAVWFADPIKDLPRAQRHAKIAEKANPDAKWRATLEEILARR